MQILFQIEIINHFNTIKWKEYIIGIAQPYYLTDEELVFNSNFRWVMHSKHARLIAECQYK